MSRRESWAYLSRVVEGPSHALQELLRAGRDADEITAGVRSRASWLGGLAAETESRYSWDRPELDLGEAQDNGFRLLTPEDPGWPAHQITDSFTHGVAASTANQEQFRDRGVAPHALWVRGESDLQTLLARSVAFVGTRASSAYGHHATVDLVAGLAAHRYTVVSGGAVGIDTVAHETALARGVPTVVVAACGPGVTYPRKNAELFGAIADNGGAVVTEYPPGVAPDRHRFLTRNRLVAALTQGTVIVEAAFRSGALNTLNWVNYYGRRAMAVPGPILGPGSLGTNLAIRDGKAAMALNAADVHEMLSRLGEVDADGQRELEFPADPVQALARNELRVYDALPASRASGAKAEDIARAAGLSVALSVHLLVELSRRGLVVREGTTWRRAGGV
ncbi:DNA-processing protein DprA [Corynebacterium timonense]|uniref:DNA processing protein n=1 Tax=Corynebacterium timonense TaxID=441500 RepID=A0A1H1MZ91_9CORY|nr:DNA-processing protein DprA [Corynebacterium timonense]SDR91990.1 DNA processing protein [Corynebacterium timonense]